MQRYTGGIIALLFLCAFLSVLLLPSKAKAVASHVVISEIQLQGATPNDEFVELYNPTGATIDLANWRLTKKTPTGTDSNIIAATMSGTIASHGFFLIAHNGFDQGI